MMVDSSENELPDFVVFRAVIKYCFFLTIVPVFTFFAVKSILFDGLLGLDSVTSNVYAAIVAVVVLHIVLGLFIHRAYTESDKAPRPVPVKED